MRYTKLGYAIEMWLAKTNYLVRANIMKEDAETYDVTFEIRRKDVGKWDMLDEEHYSLTSENINMTVCKLVEEKNNDGFFNRFIDRYEYELDCFDVGDELQTKKGLGD